jgi:hypothetical protein
MATPEDAKLENEAAIKDYERALFNMATSINRVSTRTI